MCTPKFASNVCQKYVLDCLNIGWDGGALDKLLRTGHTIFSQLLIPHAAITICYPSQPSLTHGATRW